jgi:hypothetical protein
MSRAVELPPDQPIRVHLSQDDNGEWNWELDLPLIGSIYSYNKDVLAAWLRSAAETVELAAIGENERMAAATNPVPYSGDSSAPSDS